MTPLLGSLAPCTPSLTPSPCLTHQKAPLLRDITPNPAKDSTLLKAYFRPCIGSRGLPLHLSYHRGLLSWNSGTSGPKMPKLQRAVSLHGSEQPLCLLIFLVMRLLRRLQGWWKIPSSSVSMPTVRTGPACLCPPCAPAKDAPRSVLITFWYQWCTMTSGQLCLHSFPLRPSTSFYCPTLRPVVQSRKEKEIVTYTCKNYALGM